MSTQSTTPPSEGGDPQVTTAVKPVEQESATESFTKSLSANVDPIREDQVQNAMKFLSHPKVRTSPIIHRRSFLEKKGLTREEIDEAFRRVPDPSSNVTTVEAATTNQAVLPTTSTASLQPQIPTAIPQHASPPLGVVPATSMSQRYRFQWSHAILAVGILAASGAGTAVFFKNTILPRFKAWICRVVREAEDEKHSSKPSPTEEALEAAKAAVSAAANMAKSSEELLNARSEELKHFDAFKSLLNMQMEEMKSMGNVIRRLELSYEKKVQEHQRRYAFGNGKVDTNSYVDQVDPKTVAMVSQQGRLNRAADANLAPAHMEPTSAPHSKSYMEIMAMIQRGETPPGIKEVNDMPPNPNQLPTNPRVVPRMKPWEAIQQNQRILLQSQPRIGGTESQGNGYISQSSKPEFEEPKNMKITEIEPEIVEHNVVSHGIGSSEWSGRGWIPPQPPTVAMPEAVAAIRQPKSSTHKQPPENEQPITQHATTTQPPAFLPKEPIENEQLTTQHEIMENEVAGASGLGGSSNAEAVDTVEVI